MKKDIQKTYLVLVAMLAAIVLLMSFGIISPYLGAGILGILAGAFMIYYAVTGMIRKKLIFDVSISNHEKNPFLFYVLAIIKLIIGILLLMSSYKYIFA